MHHLSLDLLQTFSDCSGSVQEALLNAQSKVNQACSHTHTSFSELFGSQLDHWHRKG